MRASTAVAVAAVAAGLVSTTTAFAAFTSLPSPTQRVLHRRRLSQTAPTQHIHRHHRHPSPTPGRLAAALSGDEPLSVRRRRGSLSQPFPSAHPHSSSTLTSVAVTTPAAPPVNSTLGAVETDLTQALPYSPRVQRPLPAVTTPESGRGLALVASGAGVGTVAGFCVGLFRISFRMVAHVLYGQFFMVGLVNGDLIEGAVGGDSR